MRNRDWLKRMFNCQKTKVLILFETRDHLAFLYSSSYFSDPFILALLTKDYRASFSIMRAKCHYAPTHPASTLILRIMRMLKPPLSHSSVKLCFNLKRGKFCRVSEWVAYLHYLYNCKKLKKKKKLENGVMSTLSSSDNLWPTKWFTIEEYCFLSSHSSFIWTYPFSKHFFQQSFYCQKVVTPSPSFHTVYYHNSSFCIRVCVCSQINK